LPSIAFDDDRPPRTRDELLAAVRRDGLRRRYRRNGLIGGLALVLAVLAAVPVIARGDEARKVAAIDQPTTTVEESTTTEPAVVEETTTTTAEAGSVSPTTTRLRATTTSLVCRNSTDPRCGEFRWDPDPGPNAPLTVQVTFAPSNPKAGETVEIRVVTDDPDAPRLSGWGCGPSFGDGPGPACVTGLCASDGQPYGPWTPPARAALHHEETLSHVYADAGTFTFTVHRVSSEGDCKWPPNPYGSGGQGTATITVSPAPA
jgi:hypothetical protein